jgi:hypothetical protein
MKTKFFKPKNIFLTVIFAAVLTLDLAAQKKPEALRFDVNADDLQVCGGENVVRESALGNPDEQREASKLRRQNPQSSKSQSPSDDSSGDRRRNDDLRNSQFCYLFRAYHANLLSGNFIGARNNRNEMVEIVRGQIDTFYKQRKDGKSFRIRLFETIIDFLRVGGNLAATIMNGERAKTILNAALGSVETGRTDFKRNFQVLQTQVLINKMNTKRALILTEITGDLDKPVGGLPSESYSWYAAKNDLRRYLLAGTFDDALDTLVEETGAAVSEAERNLRLVERRSVVREFTTEEADLTDRADSILGEIQTRVSADETDTDATAKLRGIVAELRQIPQFNLFFEGRKITQETTGKALYETLVDLRRALFSANDRAAVRTVEETIIRLGK